MNITNYCPYCQFALDIAKSNANTNKFTDETVIKKIVNGEPLTVRIDGKQLQSIKASKEFQELTNTEQTSVLSKLKDNGVIIVCNNCGWSDSLPPGTIISTQHTKAQTSTAMMDVGTNEYLINDPTLPRTKNFKCLNPDCASTIGDEAVLVKQANSNIITYICCTCKQAF